jgi:hypothetical protein
MAVPSEARRSRVRRQPPPPGWPGVTPSSASASIRSARISFHIAAAIASTSLRSTASTGP